MTSPATTRLAPSPTGALHLGNIRTFLLNHLLAVQGGWRMVMRVEDLDGPRVKKDSDRQILEELRWLGLKWEGEAVFQSGRATAYEAALRQLANMGKAYPCICSRKDVEQAASAPHADQAAGVYPGTCCNRFQSEEDAKHFCGRPVAWRVRVDDAPITFDDQFLGPRRYNLTESTGDFVIFKNDGLAAYQLAVVVDDAAAGVDAVVRGDDLLDSTPRQIHLRRLLGLKPEPHYWHLPLVIGPDGRRLAKRHGDTRLVHYRQAGATREKILGLMGYWSGLLDTRREADMNELLGRFDLARVPRDPVIFSPDDDRFLRG